MSGRHKKGKNPESTAERRRGAPRGNRNAITHGFYSNALDEAQQLDLAYAKDIEGLDDEIAVLRVKLKQLLVKAPNNLRLQLEATRTLAKLVATRYRINPEARDNLAAAITEVLKEIGGSLGILDG